MSCPKTQARMWEMAQEAKVCQIYRYSSNVWGNGDYITLNTFF